MFNKEITSKLDNIINNKFNIIYNYQFDGIVMLLSGCIRSTIMNLPPRDLDFVILTQGKCQIIDFIHKFKLEYTRNAAGGYKILYNDCKIDIFTVNDLIDAAAFDSELLFYDINRHMFISCGAFRSFENRTIHRINNKIMLLYGDQARLKKIIKFIKYISNSNKRVKVRQNELLWRYKLFIKRIKRTINKIYKKSY